MKLSRRKFERAANLGHPTDARHDLQLLLQRVAQIGWYRRRDADRHHASGHQEDGERIRLDGLSDGIDLFLRSAGAHHHNHYSRVLLRPLGMRMTRTGKPTKFSASRYKSKAPCIACPG